MNQPNHQGPNLFADGDGLETWPNTYGEAKADAERLNDARLTLDVERRSSNADTLDFFSPAGLLANMDTLVIEPVVPGTEIVESQEAKTAPREKRLRRLLGRMAAKFSKMGSRLMDRFSTQPEPTELTIPIQRTAETVESKPSTRARHALDSHDEVVSASELIPRVEAEQHMARITGLARRDVQIGAQQAAQARIELRETIGRGETEWGDIERRQRVLGRIAQLRTDRAMALALLERDQDETDPAAIRRQVSGRTNGKELPKRTPGKNRIGIMVNEFKPDESPEGGNPSLN